MTVGFGLVAVAPWVLVAMIHGFGIRDPRPLPVAWDRGGTGAKAGSSAELLPSVSVIVPARDEGENIGPCLVTLSRQEYPDYSITVVDDRSTDRTGAVARSIPVGNARYIRVVEGQPLPSGWFGKPWACVQGAAVADGDLLLFTDADTRHDPTLLFRAVAGLLEDRAQMLSLDGRQELGSFGERLVQPQIFALLGLRYRRLDRPVSKGDAHNAIANGQYILMSRDAYASVGGHEAVRDEVVEDLRMAQVFVEAGHRLTFRGARDTLTTRMYHSLADVVAGWTKNLSVGARQSGGGWGGWAMPGLLAYVLGFWVVPPVVLLGMAAYALGGGLPSGALALWAASAVAISFIVWGGVYHRFSVPLGYTVLYPLGAGLVAFIVLRSWLRGEGRIEWKGRRYAGGEVVTDLEDS